MRSQKRMQPFNGTRRARPSSVCSMLFVATVNRLGGIMSSDPDVAADEVRAQVTEVALICNRILATTGRSRIRMQSATI